MRKLIDSRYSGGTPNGHKISITLEELGIDYTAHNIDISKNTQKEKWFLEVNRASLCHSVVCNPGSSTPKAGCVGCGRSSQEDDICLMPL